MPSAKVIDRDTGGGAVCTGDDTGRAEGSRRTVAAGRPTPGRMGGRDGMPGRCGY